jgi:hypothetical protein
LLQTTLFLQSLLSTWRYQTRQSAWSVSRKNTPKLDGKEKRCYSWVDFNLVQSLWLQECFNWEAALQIQ